MNFLNTIIILIILIIVINYLTNGNIKKYFIKWFGFCYTYLNKMMVNGETPEIPRIQKDEILNKPPPKKIQKKSRQPEKPEEFDDLMRNNLQNNDIFIKSNDNINNSESDSMIPSVKFTEYEEKTETNTSERIKY